MLASLLTTDSAMAGSCSARRHMLPRPFMVRTEDGQMI